jgi:hypothetical protein
MIIIFKIWNLEVVGGSTSAQGLQGLQERILKDPGLKTEVEADAGFVTKFANQLEAHKVVLDEAVFFKNGMAQFLNAYCAALSHLAYPCSETTLMKDLADGTRFYVYNSEYDLLRCGFENLDEIGKFEEENLIDVPRLFENLIGVVSRLLNFEIVSKFVRVTPHRLTCDTGMKFGKCATSSSTRFP